MNPVQSRQPSSKHTPTPWIIEPVASWSIKTNARAIIDKDRFAVAWAPAWDVADADSIAAPEEAEANASLIVEAVNNHDRLTKRVEELEAALQFLMQTKWKSVDRDNMEFEGRVTCYQLDRARAALQRTEP